MTQGNTRLARRLLLIACIVDAFMLCFLCSSASMGGSASAAGVLLALSMGCTVWVAIYAAGRGLFLEMGIQHTWSVVCRNLGGNFEAEVFSLGNSVRAGLESRGKYYVPNQTKTVYPKLREVRGTREAWTGLVKPNPGQTVDDYNSHADAFALAFHCPYVTFQIGQKA